VTAVLAMAHELRRFAQARPGLYAASVSLPDAPDEALLTQMDSMMQLTASLFADYRLNAKNVIHAVRGLRSLLHGFIAIEAVGSFYNRWRNDSIAIRRSPQASEDLAR
jgi:hypothetical protein